MGEGKGCVGSIQVHGMPCVDTRRKCGCSLRHFVPVNQYISNGTRTYLDSDYQSINPRSIAINGVIVTINEVVSPQYTRIT